MTASGTFVATIAITTGKVGRVVRHVLLCCGNDVFNLFLQRSHGNLWFIVPFVVKVSGTRIATAGTSDEHVLFIPDAFSFFGPQFTANMGVLTGRMIGSYRGIINVARVGLMEHGHCRRPILTLQQQKAIEGKDDVVLVESRRHFLLHVQFLVCHFYPNVLVQLVVDNSTVLELLRTLVVTCTIAKQQEEANGTMPARSSRTAIRHNDTMQ